MRFIYISVESYTVAYDKEMKVAGNPLLWVYWWVR